MASYRIAWKNSAKKELKRLDRTVIPKIIAAAESLAADPHPSGHKKLQGSEHTYRIRIGDYRVVYSIEDQILLIEIIKVGHRKKVYKK